MYQKEAQELWRRLPAFQFVNLVKQVGRTAAETLLGGGIEFKHKNEEYHKIWHDFERRVNFFNIMWNVEEMTSQIGVVFITLNRSKTGELWLNIAQPYYSNGMGYSFANEEIAVMFERFEIDNKSYIIRSVYDREKVVRTAWDNETHNRVDVFEVSTKLPPEKQFNEVDYHHFGFVPVFAMYNRPYFPFITNYGQGFYFYSPWNTTYNQSLINSGINELADWANCSGLPVLANYAMQQFYKELSFAKTRVVSNSNINSYQDNELAQDNNQWELINSDFFINKNGGEQISIMQNPNHFIDYQESYDYLFRMFFKWCGYSYVGDTSSAQKTAQESFQRYEDTLRTCEWKRTEHGRQWKNIIVKIYKAMGIDLYKNEDDWSFEIRRNVIVDKAVLIDNLTKQQQLGIIDRAEMISQIKNIDYDQAEALVDSVDKKNKEEEITPAIKQGQGVEGVDGANFQSNKVSGVKNPTSDKGGRPTK